MIFLVRIPLTTLSYTLLITRFPTDASDKQSLEEYLRKTLCQDLLDHVIQDLADGYEVPNGANSADLLKSLPTELAAHVVNIQTSITQARIDSISITPILTTPSRQSVSAFIAAVTLEALAFDLEIHKIDKKIARALLKQHKTAVLQQLASESDPVVIFRLLLSAMYITHRGTFIYTSARLTPIMLRRIKSNLASETYSQLEKLSSDIQLYLNEKEAPTPDLQALEQHKLKLASACEGLKSMATSTVVSLKQSQ